MTHKGLLINLSNSTACHGKEQIELSKNEVKILSVLVKHKEKIVSRDNLMEELWQSNEFVDDNTLTVNINRLRKKLDSIGLADYIVTKRGQGYLV